MAFKSPEKKKKLKMISHYMEVELFERMRKAASQDDMTMTNIINFAVSSYLDDRDKHYDPHDILPGEEEAEPRSEPDEPGEEDYENPDHYEDPPEDVF